MPRLPLYPSDEGRGCVQAVKKGRWGEYFVISTREEGGGDDQKSALVYMHSSSITRTPAGGAWSMDAGGEALGMLVAAVAAESAAEEEKGRRGEGRDCCGCGGGDDAVVKLRQPQEDSARAEVEMAALVLDEDDETAPVPRWRSCLRSMTSRCLCWSWICLVKQRAKTTEWGIIKGGGDE